MTAGRNLSAETDPTVDGRSEGSAGLPLPVGESWGEGMKNLFQTAPCKGTRLEGGLIAGAHPRGESGLTGEIAQGYSCAALWEEDLPCRTGSRRHHAVL